MIPLLLSPPKGKPARVLGSAREALPILQNLTRMGWPVVLHDPRGGREVAHLPGLQAASQAPTPPSLRGASMVLITTACPPDWKEMAHRELEGSGVPVWDAAEPGKSTLGFPSWFPGRSLSMAVWGGTALSPWEAALAEDFARVSGAYFTLFVKLAEDLRALVLDSLSEEAFRSKVVSQLTRPEILALLLKGEYDAAKTMALKIVGTTTRALD